MNLIKTFFISGLSSAIKLVLNFLINKLFAIYLGPSGFAIVGNFQNFLSIIVSFSTGGINNGVIKYIAEYDDPKEKNKTIANSFLIATIASTILCLILTISSKFLSNTILNAINLKYILFLAFTVFLISYYNILICIINGFRNIKKVLIYDIIASLVNFSCMFFGVIYFGLHGALVSLIGSYILLFIIIMSYEINYFQIFIKEIRLLYDKAIIKKLFKYSLMTITAAICFPLTNIFIRNHIITYISQDAAGYWEAVTRISYTYLLVATTALGVYYLPKLSETRENLKLRNEVISAYKIVLPFVLFAGIIIFIFKTKIILILFSNDFMPMQNLFFFQILGDVFKIATWLLGYVMVAKTMLKLYIVTEIFFSIFYAVSSYFLLHTLNLKGVTVAYFLTYLLNFITLVYVFRNLLFIKKENYEHNK